MENPGDKNDNHRESIRSSQNRRITVVMSVITLVFLICLWPYALKLMSQTNNELLLIIFARDMPNLASITSIRRQDLRVDDSGRPLSARALTIYNLLCSVYLPATNTTAERAMTRMGLISTKKRLSMIDEKFSTMMFLSDV